NGDLVGINTAILSRTGSYTGYAFAVPVDIAKKVVNDLIKYKVPQKAIFGGDVIEYDFQNAKKFGLEINVKEFRGVLLGSVDRNGAASKAGLEEGDIITKINSLDVNEESTFEEELSYRYPGDRITVTFVREGKQKTTEVTLLNKAGETKTVTRNVISDGT